ncbi:hypothetical protein AXK11_05010 [Cephaloticoccus primus]|uniref:ABC transporter permease n=1 Tax=Cephaloticoccus primus TaxID=1548207 RepID=A0A139SN58_9BACT|nr:ABC transporter permease subunit [Cephaloticoccus primus]KXU35894.1 hypothetical protein AXK11_05010 [Cephaloticoccus primus]
MISTIVRHEFKGALRDGRFRWAGIIIALLLLAALFAGWSYHRDISAQRREAAHAEQHRWLNQPEKNPHSAAHYGVYAFKPRLTPALIDPGVEPYAGVATWMEAHRQNDVLYRPAEDATAAQRFGDLTVALVLQLLLPLLIVAVGFGAVSAERERGTLRQVSALGLSPTRWLFGKALGLASAFALLAVPALLCSGLVLAALQDGATENAWGRFGLLALVYLVYLAVFLFLTLGVSASVRSSRASLIILLGVWMLNGLLVPRTLSELAASRHPVPSVAEVKNNVAQKQQDPEYARRAREIWEPRVIAKYGLSGVEELNGLSSRGLQLLRSESAGYLVFDEAYGELHDQIEAQNAYQRARSWIAPLAALQPLSRALAGTDFAHHRAFIESAEAYRRVIQDTMNEDILLNDGKQGSGPYLAGADLWAKVPPLVIPTPTLGDALRGQCAPLVALVAWFAATVLFFVTAARRLRAL